MNKKLLFLLAFVLTLGLSFTACSDDDDDDTPDYAKEIAATYEGKLDIEELEILGLEKDITLSRTANNVAKLELKDFQIPIGEVEGEMRYFPVGDIVVSNITVSKSGSTYSLAETKTTVKAPSMDEPGTEIEAGVVVKGTVVDGKMKLTIDVDNVPVFDELAVTFEGTAKK